MNEGGDGGQGARAAAAAAAGGVVAPIILLSNANEQLNYVLHAHLATRRKKRV